MGEDLKIVFKDKPEWGIIGQGIRDYNKEKSGDSDEQSLCFVVENADNVILGGVIGFTHWRWCSIELLWMKEELRGKGYGHQLLEAAEREARKRGAKKVYLDTFSFQAPDFYLQHGYEVYGELEDFPPGHQRYYFTKAL